MYNFYTAASLVALFLGSLNGVNARPITNLDPCAISRTSSVVNYGGRRALRRGRVVPGVECDEGSTGGAVGDPHFKLWGGRQYDFHGVCDLVLLHNPHFLNGIGMDIHIRTKKTRQWSYISSAAFRIGNDTFEVAGGKNGSFKFWVNGMEGNQDLIVEGTSVPESISGYFISCTHKNSKELEFIVDVGGGQEIEFTLWSEYIRVDIRGAKDSGFGGSLGLMGTFPEGVKMARDNSTAVDDVNKFGQEWQVLATDAKLFHNDEGPRAPEKCFIPSATEMRRRLGETTVSREEAETACSRVSEAERDMCIFDVMATNDFDVAGAY